MPTNDKELDKSYRLRQRAETMLQQRSHGEMPASAEMLELIYELEVYQVELEIQNEELRRAQEEISALHREYEDLYEFAPCGYVTLNAKGIITRCNLSGVILLGAEKTKLTGMGFSSFVVPRWRDEFWAALKKAGHSREKLSVQLQLTGVVNKPLWVLTDIQADRTKSGEVAQWRLALADITARKEAEEALRRSHEELENRVVERTNQLSQAVSQLEKESLQRQCLTFKLITAQEEERGRLARDLHDDFGQSLQVLSMQINAILRRNPLEPAIRQQLENVVSYLREVTSKVRRLSHDLSPPSLEQLGLTEALQELIEEFQGYHENLVINAYLDEAKGILPLDGEITIYRVAQEFLNNTYKHANATQLAVTLKILPDKITVSLQDNGTGFDWEKIKDRPKDNRGLGLTSIEERLKMLGSQFSLTSQPGHGTSLSFEIIRPVKEKTSKGFEV